LESAILSRLNRLAARGRVANPERASRIYGSLGKAMGGGGKMLDPDLHNIEQFLGTLSPERIVAERSGEGILRV
jgi:hypothetical protein